MTQLNANTKPDIGGIAAPLIKNAAGRVAHFVGGAASGRGSLPGGSLMRGMTGGGEAAGGGAGEAAGAAEGIGAIAEEAAPLALLA